MKQPSCHHPLYGEIPLIRRTSRAANGKEYAWLEYDPDFQPPLPKGAVRGEVWRQRYCKPHHVPKYFYVDEDRICLQCREPFTFTAEEQKYWYETLQFNFSSSAVRCRRCRRERQTLRGLREKIAKALERLTAAPDDPAALIDLADATVRYRERTGQGDLDRAIAASRRAHREWPASAEPLFWEGKCHALAGRVQKARDLLEQFIRDAAPRHRLARMVNEAKRTIAALDGNG